MKAHQRTIGKSNEWFTDPKIVKALGKFDLDPCHAVKINPIFQTAHLTYNIEQDGLRLNWFGRVWLNPPFNRYERPKWMKKMADHNNGIMLIPAACETDAFYDHVWPYASGILFLKGRPHFYHANGERAKSNSGCTICLVSYNESNYKALRASNLGKVIRLNC